MSPDLPFFLLQPNKSFARDADVTITIIIV